MWPKILLTERRRYRAAWDNEILYDEGAEGYYLDSGGRELEKPVFGKYKIACEIANAVNISERARLMAIREDINKQIDALNKIIDSNEKMAPLYETEE